MKKQKICINTLICMSTFMFIISFVLFEKKYSDYTYDYLEDRFSEELSKMDENDYYPEEYLIAMADTDRKILFESIRSDPTRFFLEITLGISSLLVLCIGSILEGCIYSEDAAKTAKAPAIAELSQAHHDERKNAHLQFDKKTAELMRAQEKLKVLLAERAAKE